MGFVGDDGEFTGFDLGLAAEVADRLSFKLELQQCLGCKDMELSSGNIDCVWNDLQSMVVKSFILWTQPYMANNQVFVVRADSILTSWDLLVTVVVAGGSSAEAALADLPELVATFGNYITACRFCLL